MDKTRIGEFELIKILGKGGMGVVYLAKFLESLVALKVVLPEISEDREFQLRFLREMGVIKVLDHPNIVKAIDYGVDLNRDLYFVALEFVDGTNLGQYLHEKERVSPQEAMDIGRKVALGLQHSHEHHYIHRDIKPGNILLGKNGEVKITDFGLVGGALQGPQLTGTDEFVGTYLYLAPEMIYSKQGVDIRLDIYALGITLFEIMAGQPPFTGRTPVDVVKKHRDVPLPSLREFGVEVHPEIEKILKKMTHKDPQSRYATPGEVAEAIERVQRILWPEEQNQ